jgi:hypothetical protein
VSQVSTLGKVLGVINEFLCPPQTHPDTSYKAWKPTDPWLRVWVVVPAPQEPWFP